MRPVECDLEYSLYKVYSYSWLNFTVVLASTDAELSLTRESTEATFLLRLKGQAGEVEVTTWLAISGIFRCGTFSLSQGREKLSPSFTPIPYTLPQSIPIHNGFDIKGPIQRPGI